MYLPELYVEYMYTITTYMASFNVYHKAELVDNWNDLNEDNGLMINRI